MLPIKDVIHSKNKNSFQKTFALTFEETFIF